MSSAARVAVVSGGAGGIGASIVDRLVADGCLVANLDLAPLDRAGVLDLAVDLADATAIAAAVAETARRLGPPAVLVHAAAYQVIAPLRALSTADWDRTFAVNVGGGFHLARETSTHMVAAGWGRIVMLTSSSYFAPPPGMAHYIASKGALTGLVRALSVELGGEGVTVNAVAPGLTRTPKAQHDVPAAHFAAVQERQAIPRAGLPADIAGAVAYLVSDDAGFVTGQTLLVDGGESRL